MLSERLRASAEAAPWAIEEVKRLEADLAAARVERDGLSKALQRVVDLFRMYRDDPPSGWDALADDMYDAALAALPEPKEAEA